MTLLRRTKSVPLVAPPPTLGQVLLPNPKVLRKRAGDVRRLTDLAVERAETTALAPGAARFAEIFALLLTPFTGDVPDHEVSEEELEALAAPVRPLLERSASLGTAFAEVETTECGTQAGRSDAAIYVALQIASYVHTQFGPEVLRAAMTHTVLVSYYLARAGEGVEPFPLIPPWQDLGENLQRASAMHPAMVGIMQAGWDVNPGT